jgi:endoplasmic reticulum protein 29
MSSRPVVLLLCALASSVHAYTERGLLKLDNTTFDRIIDGSRSVFVRFDKEYAYGDDHDNWKDYAKTVGQSSADLLSCDVGVSEYGDKDNADLAERYSIKSEDFPQYRLWTKGSASRDQPIKFDGAKKTADFLRFVQEKAGAWIGLPGQVKELDVLAKELVGGADAAECIAKAEKVAAESDAETAKFYIKAMQKSSKDAEFIAKETARLTKMMDDGSVKPDKKEQFGRRLNVLSSFS